MIPANTKTFSDDLNAIRFPKPEIPRKPIEWIVPLEKLDENRPPDEWASEQAFSHMMNQIKLLQKLESDRMLTEKLLPLTDDETVEWDKSMKQLVKGIVENFSIMEVIHNFPQHTKVVDGKMVFDMESFKNLISKNEKGEIYIDEYQATANEMNKKSKETKKKNQEKREVEETKKMEMAVEECKLIDEKIEKLKKEAEGNTVLTEEQAIAELTSKDAVVVKPNSSSVEN